MKAKQGEFLILGFREDCGEFFWVPYVVISLIVSFTAEIFVRRRLKKPIRHVALADEEKVLQVLRDRGSVTQTELV